MYENIRTKLNKFADGGKIPKYLLGGGILPMNNLQLQYQLKKMLKEMGIAEDLMQKYLDNPGLMTLFTREYANESLGINTGINAYNVLSIDFDELDAEEERQKEIEVLNKSILQSDTMKVDDWVDTSSEGSTTAASLGTAGNLTIETTGSSTISKSASNSNNGRSNFAKNFGQAAGSLSVGAGLAGAAGGLINTIAGIGDNLAFGDKNFSETSNKIDSAVHGISGAVAGIVPWGTLAAGVMEGLNFASKAGGNAVAGYDVLMKSSGYSDAMTHMDDSSSRGLFGIDFGHTGDKLAKRNRNLRLALKAAQIDEENSFEQEARTNSIENTIMNNLIALAGGLQTNMISG